MRGTKLFALGFAVVFLLAACSNDDGGGGGSAAGNGGGSQSSAAQGSQIAAADSALGTILTDRDGNTLYAFLNDKGDKSSCYDDCASSWPALTTDGAPVAGDGVDGSLLGTTDRTDGSVQVTYGGHPLYFFSGDQKAGDTNGQEVGDVWYVISPQGDPIEG